jgi:tetratricopeptide (TPR) repeat protein
MLRPARARVRLLAALLAVLAPGCAGTVGADPGPPDFAGRGQIAFYDTLFGIADRNVEAVALLESAVAQNPKDGRSYFLLGMLRMLRFSRNVTDPYSASDVVKQEISEAQAALDAALPLLPTDRRVLGFHAAAAYTNGVVTHDDDRIRLGLKQLHDAVTLFPEFNTFTFIGAVAPVVSPNDPLYQEVLQYVGRPLSVTCPVSREPELCGNVGKAPHNIEGTFVLFGDVFAKAGDAQKAEGCYRLALSRFSTSGGPWRFRSIAEERLQTVMQRVALYKDADASHHPRMLGYGAEACAICHYK